MWERKNSCEGGDRCTVSLRARGPLFPLDIAWRRMERFVLLWLRKEISSVLAAGERLPSDGTGAILFSGTDVMISLIATLISPCKSSFGFFRKMLWKTGTKFLANPIDKYILCKSSLSGGLKDSAYTGKIYAWKHYFFKFIYFWLHWVFIVAWCAGFSLWWLLVVARGLSSCDAQA